MKGDSSPTVVALPAVLTGCPLVRFGLLPERVGMQLPSRLRTVTVPSALHLGRFLVQLLGAAVCGKLTRLRSRRGFPCSRHPVRFVRHHSHPVLALAAQSEAAART